MWKNSNYIHDKHFVNIKDTIYGNELPRGTIYGNVKKKKYGNNRSKVMSKASENEKLQFQASTIDLETHETKQTWIKWIYSHNQ